MQVYSNKEVQRQRDELLKTSGDLSEWEQKFIDSIKDRDVLTLSTPQKSKITELWESHCS